MDSSTKRKVGAIALIVAGIGAFLVPFLLHSPGLQASNNGGGNTNGNNSGGTTKTTPSSGNTGNSGGSGGTTGESGSGSGSSNCSADESSDPSTSHDNEGKHLAKGQDGDQANEGKHLALGHDNHGQAASLVAKAQGFMHALGKHNPQHDATHSTKTDNDTVKNHTEHSDNDDSDGMNACADDNDDSDDQGQDD